MKNKLILLSVIILLLLSTSAIADEGMWLYNAFPTAKVKAKYGFAPTQAWLDHLRLASVRMGASASFVSPDGLVFTNHHVGAGCVHNLSTADKDYIKDGFYAPSREQEPKCPGIEVSTLIGIQDVTKEIQDASKPGMTDAQAGMAQRQEMSKLERQCSDAAQNIHCQTVTLYSGGMYHLYKYKQYNDVRLVMAPEFDAAFFGGDPDNFTYPRYDLDITFFRVYENGKPIHVTDYLPFTTKGVKEGELVFASGNPGSTGRLLTMAQLEYLRDVAYPYRLKTLKMGIDDLLAFSDKSPENARVAERVLFGYQNSFKALTGYQSGLMDKKLMAQRAVEEQQLRAAIAKDAASKTEYDAAFEGIAEAMKFQRDNFIRITFVSNPVSGRLSGMARILVQAAEERTKPNEKRLRGFQDQALPSLQQSLFSPAPISKDLELMQVTEALKNMTAEMGATNPFVEKVLAGKSPEERANELVMNSKLDDVAVRKQLYEGGQEAIAASTDPMIVLWRTIDPESREVRKEVEDKVDSVVRKNGGLIAKARFKVYGTDVAPDATGTLRLSYGKVASYTLNGKKIPFSTNMGGAFKVSAEHGGKPPYALPASWLKAKDKINPNTVLDTVNTVDSIGGNSGSPVVNTNGEIIGILFDGNIESLPWNFFYDDTVGRTVLTDSRAVIESLEKIYNAQPLADELLNAGKPAEKPAAKKAK